MGAITVDATRLPVAHVSFVGTPTDAQFAAYLERLDALLERDTPYVTIVDSTEAGRTSAKQRKMKADWLLARRRKLRARCRGVAFVLPNTIQRGVLTAILWLSPMPCPHAIFASREAAEAWGRTQLGGARAAHAPPSAALPPNPSREREGEAVSR